MSISERIEALVIGAGPAGLMAADALSRQGIAVVLAEAKPSPARKLLMAGKSGLNITKADPPGEMMAAYAEAAGWMKPILSDFGAADVQNWMRSLGHEVFTGSTGRVFPVEMKASPLLRSWLTRLADQGVELRTRWRWTGWDERGDALFDTPEGRVRLTAGASVLTLGGASWARLGSDGKWSEILSGAGVALDPFAASNAGLKVAWSPHMERFFGTPVKGAALHGGDRVQRGEFIVSRRGLEGAGIYAMSPTVRAGRVLAIDLLPDLSPDGVRDRLERPRGKQSMTNFLRRTLNLTPVKTALLREFAGRIGDFAVLAQDLKALPLRHGGLRPLDEAISVAGGVRRDSLDARLMLHARPGTFCAGEMISWDAPTGGYLLTACLATGLRAGRGAAAWLRRAI